MRKDRSVGSLVTADSTDAQVVGYFSAPSLVAGLADAVIEALRAGVPAELIPGESFFEGHTGYQVNDTHDQRLDLLYERAELAERRAQRAMRLSLDPEADEYEAAEYQKQARASARLATSLRAEAEEIENLSSYRSSADAGPLIVSTDVWVAALARLKAGTGRVSQAEAQALRTIVPRFEMTRTDGQWIASCDLRVNTTEGVARLGPISWVVGRGGKGTPALTVNMRRDHDISRDSRRELRARLLRTGAMQDGAVAVAINSPFQQLPVVLAHRLGALPSLPDWVGSDWRDETFVAWLAEVYTTSRWCWLGNGKYAELSTTRQLIVDYALQKGTFNGREVLRDLPLHDARVVRRIALETTPEGAIRSWKPSLHMTRDAVRIEDRLFAPIRCACGEAASVVTRIPENPSDLLCDCRRAPGLAHTDELRFPSEYLQLRVPHDECVADVQAIFEKRRQTLSVRARQVMGLSDLLTAGATPTQLSDALRAAGLATQAPRAGGELSVPLRRLAAHGLVRRDDSRPAIWSYTDAGLAWLTEEGARDSRTS